MDEVGSPWTPSRRAAIASAFGLVLLPSAALAGFDDAEADEREVESVRAEAQRVGLGAMGVSRNDDYLGIGDAPESFRKEAIGLCLGLARDYFKHFGDKGFAVSKPARKMTLVILANRRAFAAYCGGDPAEAVGGMYEPSTNRLILFDNRASGANPGATKDNTLVLFHEATHQLTFSSGLLDSKSDLPLAIAEGLGNYGETRSPNGRTKIGAPNPRRLAVLIPPGQRKARPALTPVAELITNDERLEDEATHVAGYSEAWLLVHYLMKTESRLPQFRAYLDVIRTRRDPSHRREDWEKAFGDPAKMDRELSTYAIKLA